MSSNPLEARQSCEQSLAGDKFETSQYLLRDCDMKGAGNFSVGDRSANSTAQQYLPDFSISPSQNNRDSGSTPGRSQNADAKRPDEPKKDPVLSLEDLRELRQEQERQERIREEERRQLENERRYRQQQERFERERERLPQSREDVKREIEAIERELKLLDLIEERNRLREKTRKRERP